MRIYVIRHGHRADEEPDYTDGPNPPLSGTGRRQAELMAEFMAAESLDALYSSCMLRAIETTQPLHQTTGLPLNIWPVLCETTMQGIASFFAEQPDKIPACGAWPDGKAFPEEIAQGAPGRHKNHYLLSELPRLYPGALLSQPYAWPDIWWPVLNRECFEQGWARMQFAVEALIARHAPEDRIAVVGHGYSGDVMLSVLMQLPGIPVRRFASANTGIARFDVMATGQRVLFYCNRKDHLRTLEKESFN